MWPVSLVILVSLAACGSSENPVDPPPGPPEVPDPPGPKPSLAISLSVSNLVIDRGWTDSLLVTLTRPSGYHGTVSVTVEGLPNSITAWPAPLIIAEGKTTATLHFDGAFDGELGNHTVNVRAAATDVLPADLLPATASLVLDMRAFVPFRLAVEPETLSVRQNDAAAVRIKVSHSRYFPYQVDLSSGGGPDGLLATIIEGVSIKALNVIAGPSVTVGEYSLGVTGTAIGPREKTVTVKVKVIPSLSSVMSGADAGISAGHSHTCGLQASGSANCWGRNDLGALGDGTTVDPRTVPVPVTGGHIFVRITSGTFHTCGLTSDRSAWCWGANDEGMVGDGTTTGRTEPTPVSGGLKFLDIAAGGKFVCGVATSGTAHCWGSNWAGQLGIGGSHGDEAYPRLAPVQVAGELVFVAISAGSDHACGLTGSGKAYCWGHNYHGQVGNGSQLPATLPGERVPVAVATDSTFRTITTGSYHTCALTAGGFAMCWGADIGLVPVPVPGGLRFGSLSSGGNHACGLTTSGSALCWGSNEYDALGNGTGLSGFVPTAVVGGTQFRDISASRHAHTCAISTNGEAWCWGLNLFGQLGDGTRGYENNRPVPVRVAGGLTFRVP